MSAARTAALARIAGARRGKGVLPRRRYPALVEVSYGSWLRTLVADARQAVYAELDLLERAPIDDALGALALLRARFNAALSVGALRAQLTTFARRVTAFQAQQLDRQVRAALGVGLASLDLDGVTGGDRFDARRPAPPSEADRVAGWVRENAALIRSLPDVPLAELEQVIARAYASGDRNGTLARELVERFGAASDRATVIARDQIGKLNGRISADRHQRMGLTSFVWRTVRDNRVRPAHRHLENSTWTYAAPPREGLPGEPIQCRCHDEPIFDDVLAELDRLEAEREPAPTPAPRRRRR